VSNLLGSGEYALWNAKPVLMPFIFSSFATVPFGLLFMGFAIFWMCMASQGGGYFWLFGMPFLLIGFAVSFGGAITQLVAYRNTIYIITDKRIIIQSGAIGLDTKFIELDKIQEVYVNIGFIDKIFGTGSLYVVTSGNAFFNSRGRSSYMRPSLAALREPYEVHRVLQEAIDRLKKDEQ